MALYFSLKTNQKNPLCQSGIGFYFQLNLHLCGNHTGLVVLVQLVRNTSSTHTVQRYSYYNLCSNTPRTTRSPQKQNKKQESVIDFIMTEWGRVKNVSKSK